MGKEFGVSEGSGKRRYDEETGEEILLKASKEKSKSRHECQKQSKGTASGPQK